MCLDAKGFMSKGDRSTTGIEMWPEVKVVERGEYMAIHVLYMPLYSPVQSIFRESEGLCKKLEIIFKFGGGGEVGDGDQGAKQDGENNN